ncbi:response regulator (plasmid) [Paraburkholderia sp. PREW-6R]|uniref:response regulator n=1 Tax=Paraburkholderia sp. PREW-6R TaxID=3141544 RepID=UPI0031F5BDCF
MKKRLLVSVVDDDESVRESLPDLIREMGFNALAFNSAEAFLESDSVVRTQCLIVDLKMPGMGGQALVSTLRRLGISIPVVFITANQSSAIREQLLGDGAVACLFKPFSDAELSEALLHAVCEK